MVYIYCVRETERDCGVRGGVRERIDAKGFRWLRRLQT